MRGTSLWAAVAVVLGSAGQAYADVPSIAKLANGDLYVAYSYSTSHSNFSKIAARRSTD